MEVEVLRSDRIVLNITRQEVLLDQTPIPVRGKPLRLLREFMSHPGAVLSKAHFNDRVWDGRPHSDAVLTTAIKELRNALGDDSRNPWAIETVHGQGYRFLPAAVREVVSTDDEPAERRIAWRLPVTIAGLLILAGVGLYLFAPGNDETSIDSIAVLPFDDLSRSGDLDWFAQGVSEELLNSLMRIPGLNVAARTSATRLAGRGATIGEIGTALRVSHVIEGSVRSGDGGTVRVTAQLIRAADGFHVWSSTWDRSLSPAASLDIQRDVADRVLALMEPSSARAELPIQSSPRLPDAAWEMLLRGRELAERRSRDSINAGLGLLHKVSSAFPDNADSQAALASAYIFAADANVVAPRAALTAAGLHAERAMTLDSDNVGAIIAASMVAMVNKNAGRALELADRALALSPGMAEAHRRRAIALVALGDLNSARLSFQQAVLLDPLSPIALLHSAQASLRSGLIEEAQQAAAENLRWNPQSHLATGFAGELAMQTGDYLRAMACLRASLSSSSAHGYAMTYQGELLWRIAAYDELEPLRDMEPVAYAAGQVSQGKYEAAIDAVGAMQWRRRNSLTPLDILLWTGEYDKALQWAEYYFAEFGDEELTQTSYPLPDDTLPAYRVLKYHGRPEAEPLSQRLAQRYAALSPDEAEVFSELFSGLSWHALQGDLEQALGWLSAARQRGLILPELLVDPLFEDLRNQAQAAVELKLMQQRAARLRDGLGAAPDCQAGQKVAPPEVL